MERRAFILLAMSSSLAGCAARGVFVGTDPSSLGTDQAVFVATDRDVDARFVTTGGRAESVTQGRVAVRIPQTHQAGNIEYPTAGANNAENFTVTDAVRFDTDRAFLNDLNKHGGPDDDIVIFIHGYNNTLAEAVYRHAQIAHDFRLTGPQIAFSWTSAAEPLGYAYDQNSIAIARDSLERLIEMLATRQSRNIVLLAHSMGSMLLTEVLRQMTIGGKAHLFNRFTTVALMSPDIDMDVFRAQMTRIAPLPTPMVVFVSQQDRALRLSARLTGEGERLGNTTDIAELQGLGIALFDLSGFQDGAFGDHLAAVSSPTAIAMLRGVQARGVAPDASQQSDLTQILFTPT